MFYLVLLFLIICCIISNKLYKENVDRVFWVVSIILTIITAIRYGSGTDYFSYLWHYQNTPNNIIEAINLDSNIDIGFRTISALSKSLNFDFSIFIIIISVITMGLYIYIINKYSKNKILSLFILFAFYHEVYITSALRQGISMAIFFIAYYEFLKNKKYAQYTAMILLATLFHKSVIITIMLPIINIMYDKYKLFYHKRLNITFIIIAIVAAIIKVDMILIWIGNILHIDKLMYYTPTGRSIGAILLRVCMIMIIYILYILSDKEKNSEFIKFQIYTYFISILIYISLSNNAIYSRFTDVFMILDIIIIPNLISNIIDIKRRYISIIIILCIGSILYMKDLNASLYNGDYYIKQIIKYPYMTIFSKDKEQKVREVRNIPYSNIDL